MRDGEPSRTASWVAFLRGVASFGRAPASIDRYAERLLSAPYTYPLQLAALFPRAAAGLVAAQDFLDGGGLRHFELRTAAIDAALAAHTQRAAAEATESSQTREQTLVLLGAGLDARGFRLRDSFARVIEIDHPATQATKKKRLDAAGIDHRHIVFAPCDFAHENVADVLRPLLAGAPGTPPAVVWEGVTMYLPAAAIDATLSALADVLPAGATLAVTYISERPARGLAALVRAAGETFRFFEAPDAFADRLARQGFSVIEDGGDQTWNRTFLKRESRAGRGLAERLAVAVRRA